MLRGSNSDPTRLCTHTHTRGEKATSHLSPLSQYLPSDEETAVKGCDHCTDMCVGLTVRVGLTIYIYRERQRQRETETDRDREIERERQRDRDTERGRERQTDRQIHRDRQRQRQTQRERETDRQTDTETDRDREICMSLHAAISRHDQSPSVPAQSGL